MIRENIGKGTPGSVFTRVPVGLLQIFFALCRAKELLNTWVCAIFASGENCTHTGRVQLAPGAPKHVSSSGQIKTPMHGLDKQPVRAKMALCCRYGGFHLFNSHDRNIRVNG